MAFDFSVIQFGFLIFLKGALATLIYCSIAAVVGIALGTLVALGRVSRFRLLNVACAAFVEPFRNTPFLVQAFLIYFGLAQMGIRLSASTAGAVILSLYGTALFSEAIRGGILSVPTGQLESARAVGMPYLVAMRRIVFPQSLGYLVPNLTNLTIGLIKDSAALSVITVPELTMAAQQVVGQTFRPIETYISVALLYWCLTFLASRGLLAIQSYLLWRRADTVRSLSLAQSVAVAGEGR